MNRFQYDTEAWEECNDEDIYNYYLNGTLIPNFDDDEILNDKVSITDSVSLVIHHNIVTPIINNVVAIFDRIFEKQKLEINKKVLDNFVADTKYQYTTSFVQETDLIVLQLNDVQTNYIFENIINKNLENINLDFSFLILLAPFSTLLIFNLENIRIRKTG